MKKLFCFITTLIVTAMLIVNFKLVYASTEGEVNADSVNLRQKASTSSDIIQSLDKGAKVTIQSEEDNFYKVIYNSKVGYISKDYVSKVEDNSSTDNRNNNDNQNTNTDNNTNNGQNENNIDDDTEALTEEEAMNKNKVKLNSDETIYALPLLNSSKLGTISTDEEVTLVSINGNWAYIRTSKISGWVNKTSLSSQTVYLPNSAAKTSNNDTSKTDNEGSNNNSESNAVTNNETNTTNNTATNTESNTTNGTATGNENNNTSNKEMYVNVDAVNVRAEPSTSATILNSVEKSNKVEVLDTSDGEWYKIKTSSGTTGYVLAQYLSANK